MKNLFTNQGKFKNFGLLNPKVGFSVSLVNRSIQDHLDRGASKESKNSSPEWILWYLLHIMIQEISD